MKKYLTGLQLLLSSMVLVGCVNDNYNFNKIDVTLGFGGDHLTLPTNNSVAEIQLHDLLNIENTDIVHVAENGDYMFGKDPEIVVPVSVTIEPFKLMDATEYGTSVDIAVPAALKQFAGQVYDVSNMGIVADGRIATFGYDFEVPEAVQSLKYVGVGYGGVKLSLDLSMPNIIRRFEYVELELPPLLEMTCLTSIDGATFDAATNKLRFVNYQSDGRLHLDFNVTRINIGYKDIDNHVELKDKHLYLTGTVKAAAKVAELMVPNDEIVHLSGEIDFSGIDITSAYGVFDPDINMTDAGTVNITSIPDFLLDQEVLVDLDNPQIWLKVRSTMPLGGTVKGILRSDTYPQGIRLSNDIHIKPSENGMTEVETRILLCRYNPGVDTNVYQVIEDDNLSKLVNTLHEGMKLEFQIEEVRANQQPGTILLGYEYHLTPTYTFTAPLAFGPNATIVYRDTFRGWNPEINSIQLSKGAYIHLTATAVNKIPANLDVDIVPIDAKGNHLTDFEVKLIKNKVAGSQSDNTESPIEVEVIDVTGYGLNKLDGLSIRLKAASAPHLCGVTLNKSTQTLALKDIKVEIIGKVVYDAN